MSEIGNIISLQFQANPSALQKEVETDKNKAERNKENTENIPMHKHADKAIEDFLHGNELSYEQPVASSARSGLHQTEDTENKVQALSTLSKNSPNDAAGDFLHAEKHSDQQATIDAVVAQSSQAVNEAAAVKASGTLAKMQEIIRDSISKPVSDENPESVGSALVTLTESLKQSLEAIENNKNNDLSHTHPEVAIGGGFVIDLICGTIAFKISNLLKERASEESSNAFIDALKNDSNNKPFPTFQDVLTDIGKVPTELNLQKDIVVKKEEAWAALHAIMSKPSIISQVNQDIDSEKALSLLS